MPIVQGELRPFDESELVTLRQVMDQIAGLDDLGITTSFDLTERVMTMRVRCDAKVGVGKIQEVASVYDGAPAKLVQVISRVLGLRWED